MVVSLLEAEESAQLQLEEEAAAAAQCGVTFHQFPIVDRGVPTSKQAVAQLAIEMVEALDTGHSIGIHCRQGVGRSAVMSGAILVSGLDPTDALKAISRARGF